MARIVRYCFYFVGISCVLLVFSFFVSILIDDIKKGRRQSVEDSKAKYHISIPCSYREWYVQSWDFSGQSSTITFTDPANGKPVWLSHYCIDEQ